MQVLSFKNTLLFKRGIWLSAAALTACVAVPFLLDADLRKDPLPNLFGVCVLATPNLGGLHHEYRLACDAA